MGITGTPGSGTWEREQATTVQLAVHSQLNCTTKARQPTTNATGHATAAAADESNKAWAEALKASGNAQYKVMRKGGAENSGMGG